MALGDTLASHRDRIGGNKQLAPLLFERWPYPDRRPELSTIESRLSEVVGEKPKGCRFFFEDPQVFGVLADILGVSEADRADLLEEGRARMEGRVAVRAVVDTSGLEIPSREVADRVFEALERELVPSLLPAAVIVTESVYRWLPRSIEKPRFEVSRVPDEVSGRALAGGLAGEKLPVLAAQRGAISYDRWAAIGVDGDSLTIEPPAACRILGERGRLPTPPAPIDDLHTLGVVAAEVELPTDGVALRRLYSGLPDPERAAGLGAPARRLGLAAKLGIRAAATASEKLELEIAQCATELAVEPRTATAAELQALLQRAARRPVPATVVRVGDRLHAVNVPGALESAWVDVHFVETRVPMIRRLLAEVAGRTADEWREDRFLRHPSFSIEQGEEIAFAIARAGVLHTGIEVVEAPPDHGWMDALRAVVVGDPPAARLRVLPPQRSDRAKRFVVTGREWSFFEGGNDEDRGAVQVPPATADAELQRGDQAFVVERPEPATDRYRANVWYAPLTPFGRTLSDTERWLDVLDAELGGPDADRDARRERLKAFDTTGLLPPSAWSSWSGKEVQLDAGIWDDADREAAFLWMAIAQAPAFVRRARHDDARWDGPPPPRGRDLRPDPRATFTPRRGRGQAPPRPEDGVRGVRAEEDPRGRDHIDRCDPPRHHGGLPDDSRPFAATPHSPGRRRMGGGGRLHRDPVLRAAVAVGRRGVRISRGSRTSQRGGGRAPTTGR